MPSKYELHSWRLRDDDETLNFNLSFEGESLGDPLVDQVLMPLRKLLAEALGTV